MFTKEFKLEDEKFIVVLKAGVDTNKDGENVLNADLKIEIELLELADEVKDGIIAIFKKKD